jgi:hypothetical protein
MIDIAGMPWCLENAEFHAEYKIVWRSGLPRRDFTSLGSAVIIG